MRALTETEIMQVSGAGATEVLGIVGEGLGDIVGHGANVIWNLVPGTGLINKVAGRFDLSINFQNWGSSIGKSIGVWAGNTFNKLFNKT
ncbi:hypothetical protein ACJCHP_004708 [Enterobacter asburiae]